MVRLWDWYRDCLGRIDENGFVFPQFSAVKKDGVKVLWLKPVSNDVINKAMKKYSVDWGFDEMTTHFGRIGGATRAAQCGVSREAIKTGGQWTYILELRILPRCAVRFYWLTYLKIREVYVCKMFSDRE